MALVRRASQFVRDQNHWIGIAGVVIGILLSAYFYFASKQSGDVALDFKTVKIVQSRMPILKIFDDHNQPIASDVFGLEVTVWNNGDFSLGEKSDRVRRPLLIALDPDVRILGAQLQATGKSATQIEMAIDPRVTQEGVRVTWRDFDPGDAFKLLILYTAKKQSKVSAEARIIDTKFQIISDQKEIDPTITDISFSIRGLSREYSKYMFNLKYHFAPTLLLTIALVFLLVVIVLMLTMLFMPKERYRLMKPYIIALLIIGQGAMILASMWPSTTAPI